jgi:hypothetical protein
VWFPIEELELAMTTAANSTSYLNYRVTAHSSTPPRHVGPR